MKRGRTHLDYLYDIEEAIQKGLSFIDGMSYTDFAADEKTQYALIRAIEVIGEASKKVSDEVKANFSFVPWKEMSGMRDKLIHDYFGVDEEVVWNTATQDLPELKKYINEILDSIK
ncbi:MAG: DUF86 domain-containing protein [Melioribacteraceae bacterium]|nr:MAG: DUF86 domain-containing protein [Melioribacteraceae bacterium]